MKLLRRRKRFSQSALSANFSSLAGHVYLKLLPSLLPPFTRQPGPVAVLLGLTLKLRFILSPVSHVLDCVDRATSVHRPIIYRPTGKNPGTPDCPLKQQFSGVAVCACARACTSAHERALLFRGTKKYLYRGESP